MEVLSIQIQIIVVCKKEIVLDNIWSEPPTVALACTMGHRDRLIDQRNPLCIKVFSIFYVRDVRVDLASRLNQLN